MAIRIVACFCLASFQTIDKFTLRKVRAYSYFIFCDKSDDSTWNVQVDRKYFPWKTPGIHSVPIREGVV